MPACAQDFTNLPDDILVWAPSGTVVPLVPVSGKANYSTLGRSYTTRRNFVCISPLHTVLGNLIDLRYGISLPLRAWPGVCADGLNDAGLALSLQWQRDTNKVNGYTGKGPAVDQLDFAAWILGNFDTVAELKARIDNGLQVRACTEGCAGVCHACAHCSCDLHAPAGGCSHWHVCATLAALLHGRMLQVSWNKLMDVGIHFLTGYPYIPW